MFKILVYIIRFMSRLKDMMDEIERQRRFGNFKGAENIAKIELKSAEMDKNETYAHFYRGFLWYLYGYYKEAMAYLNNAILTEDMDMYYTYKFRGIVSYESEDFDRALYNFGRALEVAQKADDKRWIISILNCQGNTYLKIGKAEEAIGLYTHALNTAIEINDAGLMEICLCNIGVAHTNMGDYRGSIKYYEDAYAIADQINDKKGKRICLNNLGSVYNNMGDREQALKLFNEALKYAVDTDDRYGMRIAYNNLGYTYMVKGDTEHALEYYELAFTTAKQISDEQGAAIAKYWITSMSAELQQKYAT